jgi:hypothetical protein
MIGKFFWLGLFHSQQQLNIVQIGFVNHAHVGKVPFLFGRFLGQNVTFERVFTLDFTCSGKGEPLFGTGISFHLWHLALF